MFPIEVVNMLKMYSGCVVSNPQRRCASVDLRENGARSSLWTNNPSANGPASQGQAPIDLRHLAWCSISTARLSKCGTQPAHHHRATRPGAATGNRPAFHGQSDAAVVSRLADPAEQGTAFGWYYMISDQLQIRSLRLAPNFFRIPYLPQKYLGPSISRLL